MENQNGTVNREEAVVEIRNLFKSFSHKDVLKGVNLDVKRGENVIVFGRSGSGKSVLIKIIAGLLRPDSGSVKVFGKEVHEQSKRELKEMRLKMGFLFQNSALYDSMTVRENIEFPLRRHRRDLTRKQVNDIVGEALESVGLSDTANQFPSELSGGQAKRIGIARMLVLQPEIILYDEPTAGLDPLTSIEINNLIRDVKQRYKAGSILITHDLVCARETGDRMVMMIDGRFARQGSFEEVFDTDDERIRGFYDYNFTR